MARTASETERLRRCRRTFERAVADGVSMEVARQRVAEEDWRAAEERRLGHNRTGLCGTAAPMAASRPRPHYWYEDL